MSVSIYVMAIAALFWLVIEGGLILREKRDSRGTTDIDRGTRTFNIISIALVMCSPPLSFLFPALRFGETDSLVLVSVGILVLCLGSFLRYWAIIVLGKNFRTTVEIDQGQRIIQNGPYKYIRHPSYGGIILFCIGFGLVSQSWLTLILACVSPALALVRRINVEEEAFIKEIGDEYERYRSRTKRLIPGLW